MLHIPKKSFIFNADLHFHGTNSDGEMTILEILAALSYSAKERLDLCNLREALLLYNNYNACNFAKNSITIAALTDHDTNQGIDSLIHAAISSSDLAVKRIFFIPGTAEIDCREGVEILSYGSDFNNSNSSLFFGELRGTRVQAMSAMMDRIEEQNLLHYPFSREQRDEILNSHFSPGRNHLAQKLIQWGFAKSKEEVFSKYLSSNSPSDTRCFVRRDKPSAESVIKFIHSNGGRAVLAHPGYIRPSSAKTTEDIKDKILEFVEMGIDGMEGIYAYEPLRFASYRFNLKNSKNSNYEKAIFEEIEQFNYWLIDELGREIRRKKPDFCITGGSDMHQRQHPHQYIGAVRIPINVNEVEFLCGPHVHYFKRYLEWISENKDKLDF